MNDIDAVIAGLTKAQRKAVLNAMWREKGGAWWPAGYYVHAERRVRLNLSLKGLIRDYLKPLNRLEPLGLAIRARLQEQNNAG